MEVEILPVDQIKIIKNINLVSANAQGVEIVTGRIIYERDIIKNTYDLLVTAEEDKDADYYINYPRQKDFPIDDIDSLILDTIKKMYPKSFAYSSLLFSSLDKEHLSLNTNRKYETSNLTIAPNLVSQSQISLQGKSYKPFYKQVKIYANAPVKYIKNLNFLGYCNFNNHTNTIERLNKIVFH